MSAVFAIVRRIFLKLMQLVCDSRDGKLSPSKIGYALFVFVFTTKMLRDLPDDPWLWFVYGALVGGVEVAKKAISSKFYPMPSLPEQT